MAYNNNGGVNNALKYFNDSDDIKLKKFQKTGEVKSNITIKNNKIYGGGAGSGNNKMSNQARQEKGRGKQPQK